VQEPACPRADIARHLDRPSAKAVCGHGSGLLGSGSASALSYPGTGAVDWAAVGMRHLWGQAPLRLSSSSVQVPVPP